MLLPLPLINSEIVSESRMNSALARAGGLALLALIPALNRVPLPKDEAHEYDRAPQQNIFS